MPQCLPQVAAGLWSRTCDCGALLVAWAAGPARGGMHSRASDGVDIYADFPESLGVLTPLLPLPSASRDALSS